MLAGSVVVTALPFERKALLRSCGETLRDDLESGAEWRLARDNRVVQGGIGLEAAARSIDAVLRRRSPTALLSIGCAGGLAPSLAPGEVVIGAVLVGEDEFRVAPEMLLRSVDTALHAEAIYARRGTIVSVASAVATSAAKAEVFERTGALAVDMESVALARAACAAGIPFCAIRVILDDAWTDVPASVTDNRFRALPFACVAAQLERIGAALFGER